MEGVSSIVFFVEFFSRTEQRQTFECHTHAPYQILLSTVPSTKFSLTANKMKVVGAALCVQAVGAFIAPSVTKTGKDCCRLSFWGI